MVKIKRLKVEDRQLNLEQFIDKLKKLNAYLPIRYDRNIVDSDYYRFDFVNEGGKTAYPGLGGSYRGYYEHLAFDILDSPTTVEWILKEAVKSIGSTVYEYKGGDYAISRETPLWAAQYGENSQVMIVDVYATDDEAVIVLADQDVSAYDGPTDAELSATANSVLAKVVLDADELNRYVKHYIKDEARREEMSKSLEAVLEVVQAQYPTFN